MIYSKPSEEKYVDLVASVGIPFLYVADTDFEKNLDLNLTQNSTLNY